MQVVSSLPLLMHRQAGMQTCASVCALACARSCVAGLVSMFMCLYTVSQHFDVLFYLQVVCCFLNARKGVKAGHLNIPRFVLFILLIFYYSLL